MKVLMTADAAGGVWQYALELVKGLGAAEPEVEVHLAVLGPEIEPDQKREALSVPGLVLHHRPCRLEWMNEPEDDLERASAWLMEIASRADADVIHVNGYFHAALSWNRPLVVAAHSCVPSWWEAVHGKPAPPCWDGYRSWVRRAIAAADRVVAPSRFMLEALERLYGPVGTGQVIENGRTLGAARRGSKDPMILAAGRAWDPAKNLSLLADIAPRLEWPIWIAGETSHPDGAEGIRKRESGAGFLGRLPAGLMEEWMRRASIFCHPALYEPFGLTPLEAALCGCALVLSDIPPLREIWDGAAELVPPGDREALARSLASLIDHDERRNRCAARAAARARRFSRGRMAGEYLKLYRNLARSARTPRPGWASGGGKSAMVHGCA